MHILSVFLNFVIIKNSSDKKFHKISKLYNIEIEVGPFGAGFTMVASTTCSVDTNTEHSELANEASKVNRIDC